ncbi:MAG TPA: hypothetical protein DEA52_01920 [Clostridiaceae bacterium]|nr:hypothetical protein [Clostridiaceae bacterium]
MDNGTLRLVLIILLLIFGGGLYSYVIVRFTKNKPLVFLPTILGILLSVYLIYQIYFGNLEGFLSLGYFLLVLMILAGVLGNALAGILFLKKRP